MKILIQEKEKTLFKLRLPISALKSKFLANILFTKANMPSQEIKKNKAFIKSACSYIKKYIKEYGHFTILEVLSSDYYISIWV